MVWPPIGIVLVDGAMEMETIVAGVTFNGTDAVTEPRVAVIVAIPGATPTNNPVPPLNFATVGSEEVHVTIPVMLRVPPSLNVPIAVICCLVPCAILPLEGCMEIELRLAEVTVRDVLPVTELKVAEMLVVAVPVPPALLPVAKPLTVMEATEVTDDCQFETPVTSCVLVSENVATALYC